MKDTLIHGILGRALAITVITALCLGRDVSLLPDGRLHLDVLNVGQGDSILLTTPAGLRVLIDGGMDARPLVELGARLPISDQRIDMIVLTHPHRDHLVALPAIVRHGDVRTVLLSGPSYDSGDYAAFLSELQHTDVQVIASDPATAIEVGNGITLEVLWPSKDTFGQPWDGDVNDASVVLALRQGGRCLALLTGDLEEIGEEGILHSGADIACDLLKVGHHGGNTSTSVPWLLAVRPAVAAISSGEENSYGHPHPDVLARLQQAGIPVRRTDLEGTLSFVWDPVP